jgi:hypothetical protein
MGFNYFDQKSLWLPLILLVTLMTGYSAEAKDGKTKLTSSEIEQLYAGKTAYFQNGETEYHREDGVTFYKNSEMEILSGKWFAKENQICYRYYSDSNKPVCHKTVKTGDIVTYDGKVITLKMGDTENLQQAYPPSLLKIREIEQFYVGKTAYLPNGEIEYHRKDGVTFYKKKNEIVSGKWFTKLNQICYRYYNDYDQIYCHQTFKKGDNITFNGKVITLKMGDTEKLQKAYLSYSLELSSSEIEQLYAGKTAYLSNGETEYHREDGVTFYNSKRRIRLGKWFTEKSHICYRYYDDKTFCHKTFKKGDIVTMYGEVITLKRGDTEKLQQAYLSQEPCKSWKELAPKSTQLELRALLGLKKLDGELVSQPWTSALFNKYYQERQGVNGTSVLFGWDPVGLRYSEILTVILLIPPCDR